MDVDPADRAVAVEDERVGIGNVVVPSALPAAMSRPNRSWAANASGVGSLRIPTWRAKRLAGSDSTVKVSSSLSRVEREPSGVCGLMATRAAPRDNNPGRRTVWQVRKAMLQYGHHAPR
jgi:hypothetical protein